MAITPIPPTNVPGVGLAAQIPGVIGSAIPAVSTGGTSTIGATDATTRAKGVGDFPTLLKDLLGQLNEVAQKADATATQAALGQDVDLHQLMMSMESASMGFDLAVQVRNRLVEAYQEITKMAV